MILVRPTLKRYLSQRLKNWYGLFSRTTVTLKISLLPKTSARQSLKTAPRFSVSTRPPTSPYTLRATKTICVGKKTSRAGTTPTRSFTATTGRGRDSIIQKASLSTANRDSTLQLSDCRHRQCPTMSITPTRWSAGISTTTA